MDGRARVAWNLRRLRVARALSQENLAVDAGVDRTAISGIENATYNPSIDLLDRLTAAIGADLAELFAIPAPEDKPPAAMKSGRKRKA